MSEVKIIRPTKVHSKKRIDLHLDLHEQVNAMAKNGWKVVGAGPQREVKVKQGFVVELLRNVPFVKVIVNKVIPQRTQSSSSIVMKREKKTVL